MFSPHFVFVSDKYLSVAFKISDNLLSVNMQKDIFLSVQINAYMIISI